MFENKISCYGNDRLLFIDILSGEILDEIKISRISKLFCPIRMQDGTLLIGVTNWSNAGVLRYNKKSKKILWKSKRSFEGPLHRCEIFAKDNFVYWIKNDTEIICVNTENGEEVCRIATTPWLYTTPVFLNNRIMFGTSGRDGFLVNIDTESGNRAWALPLKNGCAFFDIYNDTVIVGDFNKKLYQVDFGSGKILQELRVGGEVVGDITVKENFVYTVIWGNEIEPIKLVKIKI
jgi:outer membrane protein assembly factor BamB